MRQKGKKIVWIAAVFVLLLAFGLTAQAAKPSFKKFQVTYSAGTSSLKPGSGKYVQIKVTPKSSVKTKTSITISNAKGKTVYKKTYSAAKNKAYTLKWNGKPSKGNAAGLATSAYVPAGTYQIKVTVTNTDKKQQKISKTKKIKVLAAKTTSSKPSLKTFQVSYSGGAASLKPGSGKYVQIKVTPKSSVKTKTTVTISNAKGKTVYKKVYNAAKNKTYTLKWNGKPSKGNGAGLSVSSYVPDGSYTVKVTVTNTDKKKQKISKTKSITVSSVNSVSPGSVTSTTQWGSKIYLTDPGTDYMAEVICRKVLTKSMSTKEKMKRLYEYVAKVSVHYSSEKQVGKIDVKMNTPEVQKAIASMTAYNKKLAASGKAVITGSYDYSAGDYVWATDLLSGRWDCYSTARVYQILLGHIGVQADVIAGTSTGGLNHGWNVVKYNGKWYFCDCDAEHENYSRLVKKGGELSWAFFLKGTKTFKNAYQFGFSSKLYYNGQSITVEKKDAA